MSTNSKPPPCIDGTTFVVDPSGEDYLLPTARYYAIADAAFRANRETLERNNVMNLGMHALHILAQTQLGTTAILADLMTALDGGDPMQITGARLRAEAWLRTTGSALPGVHAKATDCLHFEAIRIDLGDLNDYWREDAARMRPLMLDAALLQGFASGPPPKRPQ